MFRRSPTSFIRVGTEGTGYTFSILVDGRHVGTVADAASAEEAAAAWAKIHGQRGSIEAKPQSWSEANQPRQDFQTPPPPPKPR